MPDDGAGITGRSFTGAVTARSCQRMATTFVVANLLGRPEPLPTSNSMRGRPSPARTCGRSRHARIARSQAKAQHIRPRTSCAREPGPARPAEHNRHGWQSPSPLSAKMPVLFKPRNIRQSPGTSMRVFARRPCFAFTPRQPLRSNRVEDTGDDYPQRLRMVFAHVMTHLPVFIGILAIGHKGRDLGQIVVMPAAMSWPRGCARRGETAPLNLWGTILSPVIGIWPLIYSVPLASMTATAWA